MPTNADPGTDQTRRRAGPLGRGVGALLGMIGEPVYRMAITRRNRAFDAGDGVTRLDRPVVSVGNLSVGGTGKTPMVARLVQELLRAGRRPCIAMRGYKKSRHASGKSDEAEEYARLVPGVPVVAQPDRIAGLQALFETPGGAEVDVVVLDDGFQHRRVAREVDIVLIDASAGTLEDRLLPAGWLREPLESLSRAHAVVVTHAERAGAGEVERIRARVMGMNPAVTFAVCRHVWAGLMTPTGSRVEERAIKGKAVMVVCAIGNPGAFIEAVRSAGAGIAEALVLRDHDPYEPATVRRILESAHRHRPDAIVTTEKDWTKLERAAVEWPCAVYRPVLEMSFDQGWEELWGLVGKGVGRALKSPTLHVSDGAGAIGGTARPA